MYYRPSIYNRELRRPGKVMFIVSGLMLAWDIFVQHKQQGVGPTILYVYLSGSCAMMGLAASRLSLSIKTTIMKKVEEVYLPRTIALVKTLSLLTTPLGGGIVGFMILYRSLQ